MLNYVAKGSNGTGGNFVDILLNVTSFLESSAIFHFWIESVNIAGFELPQQFSLSEGFYSPFLADFLFKRKSWYCYSSKLKIFEFST